MIDFLPIDSLCFRRQPTGTKLLANELKGVALAICASTLEHFSVIQKETDERARIERVIAREGVEGAILWARRTAGIYRSAVLDRGHFAHAGACRRQFIKAYLELKRFAERGRL